MPCYLTPKKHLYDPGVKEDSRQGLAIRSHIGRMLVQHRGDHVGIKKLVNNE